MTKNKPVSNLKNKFSKSVALSSKLQTNHTDNIESKLDEADLKSKTDSTRYTHNEVFSFIRKKIMAYQSFRLRRKLLYASNAMYLIHSNFGSRFIFSWIGLQNKFESLNPILLSFNKRSCSFRRIFNISTLHLRGCPDLWGQFTDFLSAPSTASTLTAGGLPAAFSSLICCAICQWQKNKI